VLRFFCARGVLWGSKLGRGKKVRIKASQVSPQSGKSDGYKGCGEKGFLRGEEGLNDRLIVKMEISWGRSTKKFVQR